MEMSECNQCATNHFSYIYLLEIILATLLRRFKFSSTNDEIIWNLSQIISPSVRRPSTINDSGFEEEKGLPMVVELTTEE